MSPYCPYNWGMPRSLHRFLLLVALVTIAALTACGGEDTATADPESDAIDRPAGVRLVDPPEADGIRTDPPPELVILDVRTPEEFAQGHIDGATMIDFYDPGFAAAIAELDRDQPYVLYCRSGSRSGQTAALMTQLGFTDVAEIDGGILAWQADGLPLVG